MVVFQKKIDYTTESIRSYYYSRAILTRLRNNFVMVVHKSDFLSKA